MGAAAIIFTFMALPYKYVEEDETSKKKPVEEEKKPIEDFPPTYSTSPKAMEPLSLSPIDPQTIVKDEPASPSETAQAEASDDSQGEGEIDDSTASLSKSDSVPSASTDVVQDQSDSMTTMTTEDNNLKRTECNDENLVNDIFQFLEDL